MIAVPRPSDPNEVYRELAELNPLAMVADGFEDAYIGHTTGIGVPVAVYDYESCVSVLMDRVSMTREEAIEYLEFNTISAYVGQGTPLFVVSAGKS